MTLVDIRSNTATNNAAGHAGHRVGWGAAGCEPAGRSWQADGMSASYSLSEPVARRALRVPEITAYFWIIKGLSTAVGESTSDYLVQAMNPIYAVGIGFVAFVAALAVQFSMRRYRAWSYWLAVVMVGIFGTMAADVLHVGFHVPYAISSALYGVVLVVVYVLWQRTEHTLSIHSIDTPRREVFYWAAVVATFALGTATGDLTAIALNIGYLGSIVLFAVVILIPAIGYRWLRWNSIFSFWFAYVVTRPLGASVADWIGKPTSVGGLGVGGGTVSLVLAALIIGFVAYLSITHRDVQREPEQTNYAPPMPPAAPPMSRQGPADQPTIRYRR
jgi:uncharacterized membrane-anchored protein